jgi:hypothetical protein
VKVRHALVYAYRLKYGIGIAESMPEASVDLRKCKKCKKEFAKWVSNQCNQVICSTCGNVQCYICSKTVPVDYSHFRGFGGTGSCDLYNDSGLIELAKARGLKPLITSPFEKIDSVENCGIPEAGLAEHLRMEIFLDISQPIGPSESTEAHQAGPFNGIANLCRNRSLMALLSVKSPFPQHSLP